MTSLSDLNNPLPNNHDIPPPQHAFHGHHVGLLQETLFESFTLHSTLAILGYGAGRYTNRVEAKDYLWPSSQVINAWWSAVGRKVIVEGTPPDEALFSLTWTDKLLLTGVTVWGARLLYRFATRSIERGCDDPRYDEAKQEEGFWNKAAYKLFLPETLFQTVITLPFTLPFRDSHSSPSLHTVPEIEGLAVGVFAAGFTLEVVADAQLAAHKKKGDSNLNQEGVWSIVRHPNYLGDFLCHLSFPLLLYGAGRLNPLELTAPLAHYLFLRYVSGDALTEASMERRYSTEDSEKLGEFQQYKKRKNSIVMKPDEVSNPWLWGVVAAGAAGIVVEEVVRRTVLRY